MKSKNIQQEDLEYHFKAGQLDAFYAAIDFMYDIAEPCFILLKDLQLEDIIPDRDLALLELREQNKGIQDEETLDDEIYEPAYVVFLDEVGY